MSNIPAFSFGPLGDMAGLVVSPGASVDNGRGFQDFVSSGGVRRVQKSRYNPRSWSVTRPWQEPEFVRLLRLAAHGLGGPFFLYDRHEASQNMLHSRFAVGQGDSVLVDGMLLGAVEWDSVRVPVLAGRRYTVSCWTPSPVSPLTVSIPGEGIQSMDAPVDGHSYMAFTPEADGLLVLTRSSASVSGVRVHEGTPDGLFMVGDGTPCRVSVRDPQTVYQMVVGSHMRADYSVELVEVGIPGLYA